MYQFSIVRIFACVRTSRLNTPPVGSVQPGRRSLPAKSSHPACCQINGLGASRFCSRGETPVSITAPLSCRVQSGVNENDHGCPQYGPLTGRCVSSMPEGAAGLPTGMRMEKSAARAMAESAAVGIFTRSRCAVVSAGGNQMAWSQSYWLGLSPCFRFGHAAMPPKIHNIKNKKVISRCSQARSIRAVPVVDCPMAA